MVYISGVRRYRGFDLEYSQQTERDEQVDFYRIKKISDTQKLFFELCEGSKSASVASADYISKGKCVQCVEDGMFKNRRLRQKMLYKITQHTTYALGKNIPGITRSYFQTCSRI